MCVCVCVSDRETEKQRDRENIGRGGNAWNKEVVARLQEHRNSVNSNGRQGKGSCHCMQSWKSFPRRIEFAHA